MTAPAIRTSKPVEGNICTKRDLRFILSVSTLLCVVGAQALPLGRRKAEVGQRVGLGLLQHRRRSRAAPLQHVARRVVHGGHGGGVAPAEHLRHDP